MKRFTRAATLAATLLFLTAVASAQQEVPYTYQGTVHAVKPSSVDLIIGVGYALRLVHLRTLPSTRVSSEGAQVGVGDIQPGDMVRADCRLTGGGLVVDKIEIKRRGA